MKTRFKKGNHTADTNTRYSLWFVITVAIFVTSLITANIISVKIIRLFGFILPAGILIFPVSYIVGDVLTEVYGYGQARKVIWLGFFCNFMVVLIIWISKVLPPAPFWEGQAAYEAILGYTPRLLVASFIAYLSGEFFNAFVMSKMKIATKGRWLWMRTIGSTFAGQAIDSLVFITIAFSGALPANALALAIITQWAVKCTYEAVVTPLTYIIVNFLKRHEEMDVYDYNMRFNPLLIK
jgi:uncharacterized integral membrane protein (TIGR00697 family)